jgi:hypothetical protein
MPLYGHARVSSIDQASQIPAPRGLPAPLYGYARVSSIDQASQIPAPRGKALALSVKRSPVCRFVRRRGHWAHKVTNVGRGQYAQRRLVAP